MDSPNNVNIHLISKAYDAVLYHVIILKCPPPSSLDSTFGGCKNGFIYRCDSIFLVNEIINEIDTTDKLILTTNDFETLESPYLINNNKYGDFDRLYKDYKICIVKFWKPIIAKNESSVNGLCKTSDNYFEFEVFFKRASNNSPWHFKEWRMGAFY